MNLSRARDEPSFSSTCLLAAERLHTTITDKHYIDGVLVGPDPIGKIHWRITRFVRSYLPRLPRDDRYVFMQSQGYWIKANLRLFELTGHQRYLDIARQCADRVVAMQRSDGAWMYPDLWQRKGRIATVEGGWASLGLIDAFRATGSERYLQACIKWYDFNVNVIGFTKYQDALCINYYDTPVGMVPNNATIFLWFTAELYDVTGDEKHTAYTQPSIRFLQICQLDTGELPYAFHTRRHLLCYNYNAFQFLDLARYYELTCDARIWQILRKLSQFLKSGVRANGAAKYDCLSEVPEVNYWTVALAAALYMAFKMGLGDEFKAQSEMAYRRALSRQQANGHFAFSDHNYRILQDRRSYPRYLAMILRHLLLRATDARKMVS
jgi:hypothetical protein